MAAADTKVMGGLMKAVQGADGSVTATHPKTGADTNYEIINRLVRGPKRLEFRTCFWHCATLMLQVRSNASSISLHVQDTGYSQIQTQRLPLDPHGPHNSCGCPCCTHEGPTGKAA
eukprot:6307880-Amphidinium_carterae.2